ncbi:hypothetical protein I7I53_00470 [Histoplasma capsulatum var. duboisii H88]|uniref:Uncharacterized protein n=1 Tax=Ajellomyces capsulatus (strain H88) TaxID=544711 RepID=A0A8A1LFU9_AJEC8|nr:hypothetical protein I7I53_00470 [Histoplasma capsulatum var. duboisii H88]
MCFEVFYAFDSEHSERSKACICYTAICRETSVSAHFDSFSITFSCRFAESSKNRNLCLRLWLALDLSNSSDTPQE